jgi:hypothetical protein
MKEIELTRNAKTLVDDEDYDALMEFRWCLMVSGIKSYAIRFYTNQEGVRKSHLMHRMIMNPGAGFHVDHINGDSLDNRKENLRVVTAEQNHRNKKKMLMCRGKKTSSKYKGVSTYICAFIKIGDRRFNLGNFPTEEAAARAYDEAARKYFGEHAALNFPLNGEQSSLR